MTTSPETADRRRNFLLVLPFLILFLVQLAHHQLWRDELNAFGLAAASPTLSSLFHHVHYEGHPWLWYGLLWLVTKVTPSPLGMQVLQALIGTGVLLMIGLFSPFSRIEKTLLLLSYFVTFEYTVMSRLYGLIVLLLLLYLRDHVQHPQALLIKALLLGLLCNADLMGWILCTGLVAEILIARFVQKQITTQPTAKERLQAAALFLALAGFGLWSMRPYKSVSVRTTGRIFQFARDPHHLVTITARYIVGPFWPIRWSWHDGYFWNYIFWARPYAYLFIPVVLGLYWISFRKQWNLLANVAITVVCAIAFGHLIYEGSVRHFGVTFLAFIASLWILRAQQRRLPMAAYLLLGISALTGIWTNVLEWRRPFSNAQHVAQWLGEQHLDQRPIAGAPDTSVSGIATVLHRPVYFLDCNCSDLFVLFSNRRDNFSPNDIPQRLAAAPGALHTQSLLYIDVTPLTAQQLATMQQMGLEITFIRSFTGALIYDENYFLYNVSRSSLRL
jgi:hypothetical protein